MRVAAALLSPLSLLPLLVPIPAAALDVVSSSPAPYALHVPAGTATISVTFDAPPVLPADAAFRVFGAMSGLRTGTVQVAGNTASFTLSGAWMPGEMVHVNLRNDIIRKEYASAEAQAEEQRLQDERLTLVVQMRQLRDPGRLGDRAEALGFRHPERVIALPRPSGSALPSERTVAGVRP